MAGTYPDVPAPRLAYDRDGTVVAAVLTNSTIHQIVNVTQIQNINDDDTTTGNHFYGPAPNQWSGWLALVFPQNMDIAGYFIHTQNAGTWANLETSVDTTNGYDGTWVSQGALVHGSASKASMRNDIQAVALNNIKAIRISKTAQNWVIYTLHLYGKISSFAGVDKVRMWHPTLDEPLDDNTSADGAHFDWGDIQQNTSSDRTFRIKNNSASQTANSIIISQETLTDTTPAVNDMFTFSDGGAFASSIDIGNLAPGAISPIVTKRFNRPSNTSLSLWTSRTIANPTSWT